MSLDDVDVVRGGIAAFNRAGADAILEFTDPEVELEYEGVLIDMAHCYSGREGVRKLLADSWEDFDEVQVEIEECTERGGCVVVGVRVRANGRASLAPIDIRPGYVMSLRAGKVLRWRICKSYAAALDAAGDTAARERSDPAPR